MRIKCFFKAHIPAHVKEMKNEHFIMAGGYGIAAASFHHWVGSLVVAAGYFTIAILGIKAHREEESTS